MESAREHPHTVVPRPWHPLPQAFRTLAANQPGSILLETAKQDGDADRSLLFLRPLLELRVNNLPEIPTLLAAVDRHLEAGEFVVGYFSYECGEHFVGLAPKFWDDKPSSQPLAWMGVFAAPIVFDHASGGTTGTLPPTPQRQEQCAVLQADGLQISFEDYRAALERIAEHLHAGDTYQVNFTDRVTGQTTSDPLAVYETLLGRQPVPFAAFLNRPQSPILSFSPELFYRTSGGRIVVRPMKGTWPRGADLAEDAAAAENLQQDEKNRSEHVMIVDLLRNDLGRICQYGSVQVESLFEVEPYTTLLQMTSTCSGTLREGLSPTAIFASLFPSGSITGAPKRRTMQIIRELERQPRGVYTGAIGYFAPGGEACFNVAIRTVVLDGQRVSMGVGGAITADSEPLAEYEECRLKASFLTRPRPTFSLFETMLCRNSIALLPLHLKRLIASARYFRIVFDHEALEAQLHSVIAACGSTENKVRIELSQAGLWTITAEPLQSVAWRGRVLLADETVQSGDIFLRHKTTNRALYERTLVAARSQGFDEVLFLNERGEVTEGAISSIFARLDETWITPPLDAGVLPGVHRAHLLDTMPHSTIAPVSLATLQQAEIIILCNALRGPRPVASIERVDGTILWKSQPATETLPHADTRAQNPTPEPSPESGRTADRS